MTSKTKTERDRIRWLLRPLGEPVFLYLYLDTGLNHQRWLHPRHPLRLFEEMFWCLPADIEHPHVAREPAWQTLRDWLGHGDQSALDWYRAILRGLREHEPWQDGIRDLAGFWAAPELFADAKKSQPDPVPDYYEIHCHLRGAVPFLHMWSSWLEDDRARALLRGNLCEASSRKHTWAEIVNHAATMWREHLAPDNARTPTRHRAHVPAHLHDIVSVFMRRRANNTIHRAAGRYLAIYTAVRRYFLHQRQKSGLVSFTSAYARYTKLQKRRGRRDYVQTSRHVHAIMERFAQEGASAVELRPTMDNRRAPFQAKLQSIVLGYFEYLRAHTDREPIAMGLVPSLFKQEAYREREDNGTGRMWDIQAQVWNRQIDILFAMLEEIPALRYFVVGVDVAGRERGCPPRVLAPMMRRIREYNVARGLGASRPGRSMSPHRLREIVLDHDDARTALERLNGMPVGHIRLGRTVHAGEDFIDPMTGLRHIWETLETCDLGPGDRLGHALAASLHQDDVRALMERRSREDGAVIPQGEGTWQLRKPRGVHALDLAWLAQIAQGEGRERWNAELGSLSSSLLGVPANTDRLAACLHAGLDLPALPAARFVDPDGVADSDCTWHRIDHAWLNLFEDMRKRVIAGILRRRVVVESCPTSNLAVAGMKISPIERFIADGVPCAVATDDPGLLYAWPSREIEYVEQVHRQRILQQNRQTSFITITTRSQP